MSNQPVVSSPRPRIAISGMWGGDGIHSRSVKQMAELIRAQGGEPFILDHSPWAEPQSDNTVGKPDPRHLRGYDALVIMGNDYDIDPADYGAKPDPNTKSELQPDPTNPARSAHDIAIARARRDYESQAIRLARKIGLPVLGICGGMQRMNVAFGGTLNQHVEGLDQSRSDDPKDGCVPTSEVTIAGLTRLRQLAAGSDRTAVPIFRSTQIEANSFHHQTIATLSPEFRVAATARQQGTTVVKAIESKGKDHWYAIGIQWHPEFLPDRPFTKALVGDFMGEARRYAKRRTNSDLDGFLQRVQAEAVAAQDASLEGSSL